MEEACSPSAPKKKTLGCGAYLLCAGIYLNCTLLNLHAIVWKIRCDIIVESKRGPIGFAIVLRILHFQLKFREPGSVSFSGRSEDDGRILSTTLFMDCIRTPISSLLLWERSI